MRWFPTPEQFAVGAYLNLVERYEDVFYDSQTLKAEQPEVAVLGRSEVNQSVCFADLSHRLPYYPLELGPRRLASRLVERYKKLFEVGRAMEFAPERIHCQVWLVRRCDADAALSLPTEKVDELKFQSRLEELLPRVKARLAKDFGVKLEVIEREEAASRFRRAAEQARAAKRDRSNPFTTSVLLADGNLDFVPGEELSVEGFVASQVFPLELRSAADIPRFVRQLLTSRYVVGWVGFQSVFFDTLRDWFREKGVHADLGELYNALETTIEPMEDYHEDYDEDYATEDDYWDEPLMPSGTYTAHQVAEITRLILENAATLRRALRGYTPVTPLTLDVGFMLPYLWRSRAWFDPAQVEREIVRYGGDRNTMMVHFAQTYPDKRPYRLRLFLSLLRRKDKRVQVPTGWKGMAVPIADPHLDEKTKVEMWIEYRPIFTGYVLMVLNAIADKMRL